MKVLFEILTEELPAKELLNIQNSQLRAILDKHNIDYEDVNVYYTPRRIAALFDCHEFTKQIKQKILGPPKSTCFDDKNKVTKALLSFLEKNNTHLDEIFFEDTKKGPYVCVFKKQALSPVKELLCSIFSEFLGSISFSKQMRWGNGDYAYLRPVHNLVLLADSKVVECSMFGKKSVSYTFGHRFLSNGKVELLSKDYKETLKRHFVIVDQNQRQSLIKEALKNLSNEGKQYILDEDLLNEVTNLVEYPHCLEGTFEEEFLSLPQEVLISSMKANQKYFYSFDNSKLTNKFCVVSNIFTDDDSVIVKGNERVLRARFRDAAFFYEEDLKVKLESLVDKLKNMLFHKKLGSMYDRTMRLAELTQKIANDLDLGARGEVARRAAYLSKADLLTHMVYEFPEVQGVMGYYIAKEQSEGESVSKCIYEQYLPKDEVYPKSLEGIALSLADKFDLIVGGMIADLKPTGNKDPYGLRRAALSIIKIILNSKLSLNIEDTVKFALSLYEKQSLSKNTLDDALEFIKVRFINMFEEHTEIVKSVVEVDFSDIYGAFLKIEALKTFYSQADVQDLFSIKRVFNIVPEGFDKTDVDDTIFVFDEEAKFYNYVKALKQDLKRFLQNKDYLSYLKNIVDRHTVSSFFDKVLIMDKDEKIKNNRLSLLNNYRQLVLKVADFKYLSI
ncbi:Glycyl-tRNA synthetase beta chain [Desulfurella amilsii]|uniref:Glycine--tRNA ligase beta subunit n=1 Tax=Desulfurella amilsii TaxID=1562698 RepID=A0A1X4XYN3_9BACT|nr:glycine--tRNA ligase subunit beta [Desulfurella amilsii]OSS42639.1 Glycyl-tRNA synthetase beta chain [Desulfurella amilsii]